MTVLRRTLRSLKRSPIYFATATISLAIGLGLCTASFLFIDSIQHPHLPYADVDRLYFPQLRLGNQRNPPSLAEIQRSLTLLPGIERIASLETGRENVAFDGEGANRLVAHFSDDFFEVIGIRARLGRFPNAEEARTRSAVVVTAVTWHEKFGDAKEIGNARMDVGDRSYAIVGVLPRGTDLSFQGDVWVPLASESELETTKQNGGVGGFADFGLATLVVKLRPHVGSGTINSQLATIAASLTSRFVAPGSHTPAYVFQLKSVRPRPATLDDFGILMILIGVGVLVIAATNVAALSLARGLTRKRDYALRIALGASRAAIAGEVLAEIGVIAAVGSAGGVFMARAMIGALTHIVPAELAARWYVVPEFSGRLFGFAAAALIGAIALAGALPAWRASRVNPSDPLKDSAGTTTGRSRHEFRLLIVGELAVSMVLLMLASLMSLSVRNLTNYQFGYDARHLLSAHVYLPFTKDTADRPARREAQLASLARIRAADGVLSAATMSGVYL
ncbi:MAG TPA: ABC transporter permease, partial [Gemmatimonadaceae bacterium]|nr:ABC transporter permease [Gemmatimonadaceae bacterium]